MQRKHVVLVVEDDLDTQTLMRVGLSRHFHVLTAASADEARQVLKQHPEVAVILMDLSLRGSENGLSLTSSLRGDPRWESVPIIATTAHAFDQNRKACLAAGCDEYFAKPIPMKDLVAVIRRHCTVSGRGGTSP